MLLVQQRDQRTAHVRNESRSVPFAQTQPRLVCQPELFDAAAAVASKRRFPSTRQFAVGLSPKWGVGISRHAAAKNIVRSTD
jgi:hypothetical protein